MPSFPNAFSQWHYRTDWSATPQVGTHESFWFFGTKAGIKEKVKLRLGVLRQAQVCQKLSKFNIINRFQDVRYASVFPNYLVC